MTAVCKARFVLNRRSRSYIGSTGDEEGGERLRAEVGGGVIGSALV